VKLSSLFCAVALTVTLISANFSQATDNDKTLYQFQGQQNGVNGYHPKGGLMADSFGNLYGTAYSGGIYPFEGTVFELSPNGSGGWNYNVIYNCSDSGYCGQPMGFLTMDSQGNLYGSDGGFEQIYELSPDGSGVWSASLVYRFNSTYDGNDPGPVIVDSQGNVYGTNTNGGNGYGFVFEASPASGGGWSVTHIHDFVGTDGSSPGYAAALTIDSSGNLYGTTQAGGTSGCGVVFGLTNSNGVWTETVLHNFENKEGSAPMAALLMNSNGDLFGTASAGGPLGYGTAFKLSKPNGTWVLNGIHSFTCMNGDGAGPNTVLSQDSDGNLFGETNFGGQDECANGVINGEGMAFELSSKGGHWTETILREFTGQKDGAGGEPLLVGAGDNLYSVSEANGVGFGIVYELSPAAARK
jgi:uncharacterized repeat protein (TIGR03803 family)